MSTCRGSRVTVAPHLSIARRPVQGTAILVLGAWLAGIHPQGDEETQNPGIHCFKTHMGKIWKMIG